MAKSIEEKLADKRLEARKYRELYPGKVAISKRKWREKNKAKISLAHKKYRIIYRSLNPEKTKAQQVVYYKRKIGKIIRPVICSLCGMAGVQIEGHHYNYYRPFELTWVCHRCHSKIHKKKWGNTWL